MDILGHPAAYFYSSNSYLVLAFAFFQLSGPKSVALSPALYKLVTIPDAPYNTSVEISIRFACRYHRKYLLVGLQLELPVAPMNSYSRHER
jgi:hypothetical protein